MKELERSASCSFERIPTELLRNWMIFIRHWRVENKMYTQHPYWLDDCMCVRVTPDSPSREEWGVVIGTWGGTMNTPHYEIPLFLFFWVVWLPLFSQFLAPPQCSKVPTYFDTEVAGWLVDYNFGFNPRIHRVVLPPIRCNSFALPSSTLGRPLQTRPSFDGDRPKFSFIRNSISIFSSMRSRMMKRLRDFVFDSIFFLLLHTFQSRNVNCLVKCTPSYIIV